jgi:hypothetical protein
MSQKSTWPLQEPTIGILGQSGGFLNSCFFVEFSDASQPHTTPAEEWDRFRSKITRTDPNFQVIPLARLQPFHDGVFLDSTKAKETLSILCLCAEIHD